MSARSRVRTLSPAAALGVAALFSAGTPVVIGAVLAPSAQAAATASITKLDPNEVFTVGNDLVFVEGTGLGTVTGITVDGTPVDFADEGDGTLSFFTPVKPVGKAQVRLVTAGGTTTDNGTLDDLNYVTPPPSPIIDSVTPNFGPLAGGNTVTVRGKNLGGALGVVFGDFSLAENLVVQNDTQLTVTAPPGEALGKVDLLVINAGGSNDNTTADDYTYGGSAPVAPAITGLSPNAGPAGTTVTITGTNLSGASVTFGGNAAQSVTQVSATQIRAVSPPGSGTVDVIAKTATGGTSANTTADNYTYPAPASPPTVSGISPTSGPTTGGTVVTVTGTNLSGASAVTFDGLAGGSITPISSTQLRVTSPGHAAGTVDVRVTTSAGVSVNSSADDFTYVTPPPAVSSISPATGSIYGGTVVTINGSNLAGTTGVSFGGTAGTSVTNVSANQIRVTSPAKSAGKADIVVTTAAGSSPNTSADDFTYFVPAPVVTNIAPTSGPTAGGTSVTITGQFLDGATVKFGNSAAVALTPTPGQSAPATTGTATSPAGTPGTVSVIVTTAGGSSANTSADDFTYIPPTPTITSISPASGSTLGGNTVTITGTNLTGATSVKFGATTASGLTVDSATQARVTAPAGSAGSVDVSITTSGGTSANTAGDNYTYVTPAAQPPVISSVSPNSGATAGGTVVTITGTGLGGTTGVKFGDNAATNVTQVSDTSVRATAPAGTGVVSVTLSNGNGTATATTKFTYTDVNPLAPTVRNVFPNVGVAFIGGIVTIQGTNFRGVRTVKFGSTSARFLISGNTILALAPPLKKGVVPITVTTVFGTSAPTTKAKYTYLGF